MTHVFLERIMKMEPAFFVMENVVGLLMRKESKRILDTLFVKLISNNYYLDRATLNALDYGVPQYRKRVFVIGLRKDVFQIQSNQSSTINDIRNFSFSWPKAKYSNAILRYDWPDMVPFGQKSVLKPRGVPYALCIERCVDRAEELPNGDEFFTFTKDIERRKEIFEGDTKRRSFKRLHRYRYSPTTCFGNNEVFLHPYKNRRLSVREALRIQSVDDKYVWGPNRQTAKFKIIGNGVPVLLAEAVARELYRTISSANI